MIYFCFIKRCVYIYVYVFCLFVFVCIEKFMKNFKLLLMVVFLDIGEYGVFYKFFYFLLGTMYIIKYVLILLN